MNERRNRYGRLLSPVELEHEKLLCSTVGSIEWMKSNSAEQFKIAWQKVKKLSEIASQEEVRRIRERSMSKIGSGVDFRWMEER